MAAEGGAGAGAGAGVPEEDRYGDVWPETHWDIVKRGNFRHQFDNRLATEKFIFLDPATWNRYFIYKEIREQRTGSDSGVFTGYLIDNYGQLYSTRISHFQPNPDGHRRSYNDKSDLSIRPDNENYQKLTHAQIDYIKGHGSSYIYSGLTKSAIEGMKKIFCEDDSSNTSTKDTKMTELQLQLSRHDEEIARLRDLLLVSAQRGIRNRDERNAMRRERNELQGRINTATRSFARLQTNVATRNQKRAAPPANNDPSEPNARRRRNTRRNRK